MIKRATEVRLLPDPTGFGDWKDWARQTNVELQRQLIATSMIMPFIEFGTVWRTSNFTPADVAIPWQEVVYDNTNGLWTAGSPDSLVVPERAGNIKYGYARAIASIETTAPVGGPNNFLIVIQRNDGAVNEPQGVYNLIIPVGVAQFAFIFGPWMPVDAGDFFKLYIYRTGAGDAVLLAGANTWMQLVLGGPAA